MQLLSLHVQVNGYYFSAPLVVSWGVRDGEGVLFGETGGDEQTKGVRSLSLSFRVCLPARTAVPEPREATASTHKVAVTSYCATRASMGAYITPTSHSGDARSVDGGNFAIICKGASSHRTSAAVMRSRSDSPPYQTGIGPCTSAARLA